MKTLLTRKLAAEVLKDLGVENKFSLRTIDFSDLARDRRGFLLLKEWNPRSQGHLADAVKEAFRKFGVVVDFGGF
jgi:hypothetical protein